MRCLGNGAGDFLDRSLNAVLRIFLSCRLILLFWAARDDFRDRSLMVRITRFSFVTVKDFPSGEIAGKFTRPQAPRGGLFARLCEVNNHYDDPAGF